MALCAVLALPAALAVPQYDGGNGAEQPSWLYGQGAGGAWLAVPAYAQETTDANLDVDTFNNEAVFIAPNQVKITYTKNAIANTGSYYVYADFYNDDGNYDKRRVIDLAGNGTKVHTLTFNGTGLPKDASSSSTPAADVVIGDVRNTTGVLWSSWDPGWVDAFVGATAVDGQGPTILSASLMVMNNETFVTVTYDELATYVELTDYTLTLDNGDAVGVERVEDDNGLELVSYDRKKVHKLFLDGTIVVTGSLDLDISEDVVDDAGASYAVNGSYVNGNPVTNRVAYRVTDGGVPPEPLRAEIVGPNTINVTFSEPVNSSAANYENLKLVTNFNISKTPAITAVSGNGTSVQTLTLNMSGKAIPLVLADPVQGVVDIAGVADAGGNTMTEPVRDLAIAEARMPDGAPSMIAARFTGSNEVVVTYNASVTLVSGYTVLAYDHSVGNATEYEMETRPVTWSAEDREVSVDGRFARLTIGSVEGDGTHTHKIRLSGSGVLNTATGLVDVTGTDTRGNLVNHTSAPVYDEQLPRVLSARVTDVGPTGNRTIVVEYDQPVFGPMNGYAQVSSGDDTREIAKLRTGTTSVIESLSYFLNDADIRSALALAGAENVNNATSRVLEAIRPHSNCGYNSILGSYRCDSYTYGSWIFVSDPPSVTALLNRNDANTPEEEAQFDDDSDDDQQFVGSIAPYYNASDPNSGPADSKVLDYTGDLTYMNGDTERIRIVGTSNSSNAVWLIKAVNESVTPSLVGREYMVVHSVESADECERYAEPGNAIPGGFSAAGYPGCSGIGTHHMLTLDGAVDPSNTNLTVVSAVKSAADRTSVGVAGANGDPLMDIGASYRIGSQYVSPDRTATVALSMSAIVDFGPFPHYYWPPSPSGVAIPSANPSIQLPPREAVLQLFLDEPVDPSSIDASKVTVWAPFATRLDNRNVTVIDETRILIGIPQSTTPYILNVTAVRDPVTGEIVYDPMTERPAETQPVLNFTYVVNKTDTGRLETRVVPRTGNFTTLEYLAFEVTVPVMIEGGFVKNMRGGQMATEGRYTAVIDSGSVPAEVVAMRMTGGNAFQVEYTGPVGVAYENLVLDPGGARGIIDGVDGNGTAMHTVRFVGLPVHPSTGGSVSIVENLDDSFGYRNTTLGYTGYVVEPGTRQIAPLSPGASPASVGLVSVGIESGNSIAVTYTAPVNATADDYTGLVLNPGGERNVTGVSGSGTARHLVEFDGAVAAANARATIDIAMLSSPDGYAAFGGIDNLNATDMRVTDLKSLESSMSTLKATYSNPVNATISDYNMTYPDGTAIQLTAMRGSGEAIHWIDHEVLPNGTWFRVSISALGDEGSGNTYAGTAQPVAVLATLDQSATVATLTDLVSNGTELEADYTHPVDTHDASQVANGVIPPAAYYYAITHENGTAIPITDVSTNGAATHVINHAPLPNGTRILVSIQAHTSETAGTWFPGAVDRPVVVDTNATIVAPPMPADPIMVSAAAQFISPSKALISYTGPLDGPRDAYGRVTGDSGLDAPTIGVAGWGTEAHTITFNASVTETQTGEIALNKDLRGMRGDSVYMFTNDSISIKAGGGTTALEGNGSVPIARDGFSSGVNGTLGGDTARIGINITALSSTPLVSDPANNTVRFPDTRDITMTTTFATVQIPANTTAMSVPADGILELYVVSDDRQPEPNAVVAALSLGNNSVRIGKIVEIGDSETRITFDMPVRILLEGQAGGRAFYMEADNVVMPINTVCRADSTSEVHEQLGEMGECQLDSGVDKVIYTYHLTRFGTVTLVDMKTHTMVVTVMPKDGDSGSGRGPSNVVVPPTVQPGTGQPGTTFFGGGGGGGRGGGGGGGSIIPTGSGGPVLYSASWDCDDGTVRMAVNDGMRSPDIVVVSSTGTVPATLAEVQDMSGRTIYEAPLPTDGIFSIRATAVDGRAVSSVSESIRTGGACTGETVFRQYAPGDGTAQPAGMSAEDITGGEPAPAREPTDDQPRRPDAPAESQPPADDMAGEDAEPEPVRPSFEIEEGRDASYYVKRYAEQPAYREWFDSSYPQYADICEAVGVASGCVEAHLAGKAAEPVDRMDDAADADADREPTTGTAAPSDDDSGCLIATAAYGTELAPQVQALREYRDGTLLATGSGSAFMSAFSSAYYAFSPQVADLEREHPAFRQAVAALMTPMLYTLQVATHADPASEDSVLAYGIAAMLLVSVVYAGAPAVGAVALTWAVRRRRRARRTVA